MSKIVLTAVMLLLCQFANAQHKFYINPNIAAAWSFYKNSNPSITGNGNPGAGNGDFYYSLLLGYKLENGFIIESGIQYHDALDRYYWEGSNESVFVGGSFSRAGQAYIDVPLNIKRNYFIYKDVLAVVPYMGLTFSNGVVEGVPYSTLTQDNEPISSDVVAEIKAYRQSFYNILFNAGLSLEYKILDRLILCGSTNFTLGFRNINRVYVDVIEEGEIIENGTIDYHGDKFYLAGGIKIPLF